MQLFTRLFCATFLIFTLHSTSTHAMVPWHALAGAAKVCGLGLAKRFGSLWMVRAARMTNLGATFALGSDYKESYVREFSDTINDSRCFVLKAAIINGDEDGADGVDFLLDPKECLKCYQGTEQDPTLLHVALREKKYRAARSLLKLGVVDPNALGKGAFSDQMRPPIIEFARDIKAVLLLLEFGADPDWTDSDGKTLLSELIRYEEWETIKLLQDRKTYENKIVTVANLPDLIDAAQSLPLKDQKLLARFLHSHEKSSSKINHANE